VGPGASAECQALSVRNLDGTIDPPGKHVEALDMEPKSSDEVTQLLARIDGGDDDSTARLFALVYEQLRALAESYFRSQPAGHTLQPTALVHEAFMKLVGNTSIRWEGRSHFFAVAAKAMRKVLADHARRRRAIKRGGDRDRVTLDMAIDAAGRRDVDVVDLHEALNDRTGLSERQAQVVELRFFGGLKVEEAAHVLGVSPRSVKLDWRIARAWLRHALSEEEAT